MHILEPTLLIEKYRAHARAFPLTIITLSDKKAAYICLRWYSYLDHRHDNISDYLIRYAKPYALSRILAALQ